MIAIDTTIEKTIQALNKNNIEAEYFENSNEAVDYLLKEIEQNQTVGIGGSVTIDSLKIPEKLINRGNEVYFHWLEEAPEKKQEVLRKAMTTDVYLSSTNALTENGQLVNIDGVGNRVSSMIYGHEKVIIVCGKNKIVKDVHAAIKHVKANAYKNARRLDRKTPCAQIGECRDCNSPERMCNVTTIIEKQPLSSKMKVIIINEELGF
ncbi:Transcriptional regulators of sugar metabolism [Candidatus Syntrophocurvum alkaliphilum]|uniref:Transcriptional regulators of sugar metabolism n=1 Tax=Candidatus Syntrophocurvum alkaliphilum TaxID=2293317 RepID=A0A6I6DL40_9FIRM|nr:lactate utilization protein [Candidatus Syntrophocurvum alkaliphilum]QGT99941.1 Transcriptional regulators of sugar metabolism [Candidatus Syntrophocurvum alkaliphilum]